MAVVAAGCLLAVPMAAAVRASAHGEEGAWHRGGGGHGYLGFLQGVTLTQSQHEQVREIMKAAWTQDKPQVQQLRALKTQISDTMASAGSVSSDTLGTLQQQASQIKEQLDADRLTVAMQVRGLLTPDQLAQSASVHTQLKSLHEQEMAITSQGRPAAE